MVLQCNHSESKVEDCSIARPDPRPALSLVGKLVPVRITKGYAHSLRGELVSVQNISICNQRSVIPRKAYGAQLRKLNIEF